MSINHPSITSRFDHDLYQKYLPNDGGSIFTFEIKGTAKDAQDFIDRLQLFSLLANVADAKSLVIHPASTTHSQMTTEELSASAVTRGIDNPAQRTSFIQLKVHAKDWMVLCFFLVAFVVLFFCKYQIYGRI